MTTTRARTARRPNVPLTERDVADLALLQDNTPQRAALHRLTGAEPSNESALLHAVMELGLRAVQDEALAEDYRQMALEMTDEDRANDRAVRERRRERRAARDSTEGAA